MKSGNVSVIVRKIVFYICIFISLLGWLFVSGLIFYILFGAGQVKATTVNIYFSISISIYFLVIIYIYIKTIDIKYLISLVGMALLIFTYFFCRNVCL